MICTALLSCDSDDYPYSDIPSVVLNHFRAEFPHAAEVQFRNSNGQYEVEFELDGREHEVLISPTGMLLKEKMTISRDELPAPVLHTLKNEFSEKDLEDPELIREEEKVFYQVQVDRFFTDEKIVIDKTGKLEPSVEFWD